MLLLQPLVVSLFTIWLSWKQEYSKLSQALLLKMWAKKGCFQVWTGKILLYCMKRGTKKGKYLMNWSSVKTAIH